MCIISVFCVVLILSHGAHGIVNYCAQHTYNNNNTWLQLTKEANPYEFALAQQFKGLHCCARGYRSIEW